MPEQLTEVDLKGRVPGFLDGQKSTHHPSTTKPPRWWARVADGEGGKTDKRVAPVEVVGGEKSRGIAHLLIGRCLRQLRPNQVEIARAQIAARYFAGRLSLDGRAVLNRHAPGLPVANGSGGHIQALSQLLTPTYREARAVQGVWCLCHAKSITHDVFNFNTTC